MPARGEHVPWLDELDELRREADDMLRRVRAALRRAEEEILEDHVGHCVEHAIASGNKREQRRKISELIDVLSRSDR